MSVSQSLALVALFVLLPIVVGGIVMALISWRAPRVPAGTRTSELLAHGEPGQAEVVAMRALGGFLDMRPMVRIQLHVHPERGEDFDLTVVQAVPRRQLDDVRPGADVVVRLTPDHSAGAVVLP